MRRDGQDWGQPPEEVGGEEPWMCKAVYLSLFKFIFNEMTIVLQYCLVFYYFLKVFLHLLYDLSSLATNQVSALVPDYPLKELSPPIP